MEGCGGAVVRQAIQAIPPDATEPPEEWQKAVVRRFGPMVYEGMDAELACAQMVKDARDPNRGAALMPRLVVAVQSHVNLVKSTAGILRTLED